MNEEESQLEENAFVFVKQKRGELIKRFANLDLYKSVFKPVSLFMAGSPGVGKTEVSKHLIEKFHNDIPVRIDADEIRAVCPGYTGINAHLFQKAANKGVNILLDYALSRKLNFILDGTFAYADAVGNIKRSLAHKRIVEIWFVYQDPLKAWEATKAREVEESRHVSKDIFIKSFFESRSNVNKVKSIFGKDVELNLLIKDYDKEQEESRFNIGTGELDRYLNDGYTESDLQRLLL